MIDLLTPSTGVAMYPAQRLTEKIPSINAQTGSLSGANTDKQLHYNI